MKRINSLITLSTVCAFFFTSLIFAGNDVIDEASTLIIGCATGPYNIDVDFNGTGAQIHRRQETRADSVEGYPEGNA